MKDIKDYGAIPGTDSTAAINRALAAGTEVYGEGFYLTSGPLEITHNYTNLRGAGPGAFIIRNTAATGDVVAAHDVSLVGIHGVQFESLVPRDGTGLRFTNVAGYELDNLRLIDTGTLGEFSGANSGRITRMKVAHGAGTLTNGFHFIGCVDTHWDRALVNGGAVMLPEGAAWWQVDSSCDTFTMIDCGSISSRGCGTGLRLMQTAGGFAPRWVDVLGCFFEGSSGTVWATGDEGRDGVVIDAVTSLKMLAPQVSTSRNGIVVNGGVDVDISHGRLLQAWRSGLVLNGGTLLNIESNKFDSNSYMGNGLAPHMVEGPNLSGRVVNNWFSSRILNGKKASCAAQRLGTGLSYLNNIFTPSDTTSGVFFG